MRAAAVGQYRHNWGASSRTARRNQPATAEALVISEVGTRLLEMVDGKRTLEECATLIGEEFDADQSVIANDVIQFAQELVDAGIAAAS